MHSWHESHGRVWLWVKIQPTKDCRSQSVAMNALASLDPSSASVLAPAMFPPLESARGRKRSLSGALVSSKRRRTASSFSSSMSVVENEVGLCQWVEAVHQGLCERIDHFCAQWRLDIGEGGDASKGGIAPAVPPRVPDLAWHAHAQQYDGTPLCVVDCPPPSQPLCPPLLFSALVRNRTGGELVLHALGTSWVVPREAAFCLCGMRRWKELGALRPAGGYRLILLDPPWHSYSVRRKGQYHTMDRRQLLELPLPQLACPSACLIAVWVTNSRHVQRFVESALFQRWGVRRLGCWYWFKVAADGQFSTGVDPRSPHRKPWEPLLLGFIGSHPPPLPPRLALCSVPLVHSHKPALDPLFSPVASHLLRNAPQPKRPPQPHQPPQPPQPPQSHQPPAATKPAGAGADVDMDAATAWRTLPKLELFARELRPYWHSAGDQVLHFQHTSLRESRA